MTFTDEWGKRLDCQPLPNEAIYRDPQPVTGIKLANGNIRCGGCGGEIPDNSGPGLLPSCPHCWTAVAVAPPGPAQTDTTAGSPNRATDAWLDLFGVKR